MQDRPTQQRIISLPDTLSRDALTINSPIFKGPKRKRLIKACDACHKSKRRCDGTEPCSNCYFASKDCRYTDATGRPVPAPNPVKPDIDAFNSFAQNPRADATKSPRGHGTNNVSSGTKIATHLTSLYSHNYQSLSPDSPTTSPQSGPRKRSRTTADRPPLDSSLIRELVNLFFAHCHPHCLIIHKLSFNSDLTAGHVPPYLLFAICSVAAPLSRNARLQTSPQRFAGRLYADSALSLLLDENDRLLVSSSLAAAQALCLLQFHKNVSQRHGKLDFPYHRHALNILNDLDFQKADDELIPENSSESKMRLFRTERECIRRTFWIMHLCEELASTFQRTRPPPISQALMILLPCNETSFEMTTYEDLPREYLKSPAPSTPNVSEFGHVVRISAMMNAIEMLSAEKAPDPKRITECGNLLQEWQDGLSDQLSFSDYTLRHHLSMWETNSNTGAWCFAFMHALHACCVLALEEIDDSSTRASAEQRRRHWAQERIASLISTLGLKARNNLLIGLILWLQYCGPHALMTDEGPGREARNITLPATTSTLLKEFEELWGDGIPDRASDGRDGGATAGGDISTTAPANRIPNGDSGRNSLPAPLTVSIGAMRLQSSVNGSPHNGSLDDPADSKARSPIMHRFADEQPLDNGGSDEAQERQAGTQPGLRPFEDPQAGTRRIGDSLTELHSGNTNLHTVAVTSLTPPQSENQSPVQSLPVHSLPSLKASGLLDAWSSHSPTESGLILSSPSTTSARPFHRQKSPPPSASAPRNIRDHFCGSSQNDLNPMGDRASVTHAYTQTRTTDSRFTRAAIASHDSSAAVSGDPVSAGQTGFAAHRSAASSPVRNSLPQTSRSPKMPTRDSMPMQVGSSHRSRNQTQGLSRLVEDPRTLPPVDELMATAGKRSKRLPSSDELKAPLWSKEHSTIN